MTTDDEQDAKGASDVYEVRIRGVVHRIPRSRIAELSEKLATAGEDELAAIRRAFASHPNLEDDVRVEIDPEELR